MNVCTLFALVRRGALAAVLCAGVFAYGRSAYALDPLVYDAITSDGGAITSANIRGTGALSVLNYTSSNGANNGRTITGNDFNASAGGDHIYITGMDVILASGSDITQVYNKGLRVNVEFLQDENFDRHSSSTDYFLSAAGTASDPNHFIQTQTITPTFLTTQTTSSPTTAINGTHNYYTVNLAFGDPILLNGPGGVNQKGVSINFQYDATGTGAWTNTRDLTTPITTSTAGFFTGSSNFPAGDGTGGSYLRNRSGDESTMNFGSGTTQEVFQGAVGSYTALAVRLRGTAVVVPEANAGVLLSLGALAPLTVIALRRRKTA